MGDKIQANLAALKAAWIQAAATGSCGVDLIKVPPANLEPRLLMPVLPPDGQYKIVPNQTKEFAEFTEGADALDTVDSRTQLDAKQGTRAIRRLQLTAHRIDQMVGPSIPETMLEPEQVEE